jgi:hypothetical protein
MIVAFIRPGKAGSRCSQASALALLVALFALGYECIAQPGTSRRGGPAYVEKGVGGVILRDAETGERFVKKNGLGTTSDDGLLHTFYSNAAGTEVLDFVQHPGDARHSFSQANIFASECFPLGAPEISDKQFLSSNRIKLGSRASDVRRILGKPHEVTVGKSGRTAYKYSCDDPAKCPSLAKYNTPTYTAVAEFVNGRLVRYSFGYDYP